MKSKNQPTTNRVGNYSRRNFISSCAACGACMALSPVSAFGAIPLSARKKKMRIRILYSLHAPVQPRPDWPNVGFDFNPVMENVNAVLKEEFPKFEFISTMVTGKEEAEKILEQDQKEKIDGYIVYQMNCWNQVVQTMATSSKPVLYVDFKYGGSGGFLVYNAKFLREKQANVGFVSSSRIEDLTSAVQCFEIPAKGGSLEDFVTATALARIKLTPAAGNYPCHNDPVNTLSIDVCKRQMEQSRILAFADENAKKADPIMGIPLEFLSFAELNHAWEIADKDESIAVANRWQNRATSNDIPFNILQDSAAMYLGMKSLLKKHNANAITVNCLGGFYGDHIHAYPCLAFHELGNEGLIGACECDTSSTATMVAFTAMTQGRPGFISDPVIDTSNRQIIYVHCVASNKPFGPDGQENPFSITTHSEDRQGASVRSILPVGYKVTTVEIRQKRKEILFHQGLTVDNDPDDRACRTKLCAEPIGDIEKLFTQWDQWGWHRVTFYGDLKEEVYGLADAIGWNVVEEA